MAPPEKEESGGSGITGTIAAVGIACGFIGAVIGAFGWNLWKKEEMHQQHQSHSGCGRKLVYHMHIEENSDKQYVRRRCNKKHHVTYCINNDVPVHVWPSNTYNKGPCPICLSEMEELKVLSCGHQYHQICIQQMVESGVPLNCPVCRKAFGK